MLDAGGAGKPCLDVVVLGLEAGAVEVAQELRHLRVLVRHLRHDLEEAVEDVVDRAENVALDLRVVLAEAVFVRVVEETGVGDGLAAFGAGLDVRELVAQVRELADFLEAQNENRGAGGIRRLDDGAALVDGVLDLGGVRIVLEPLAGQPFHRLLLHNPLLRLLLHNPFHRLLLRDLLLFLLGDPGVVLRLKPLRETRKGLAAEHVREEVSACEADVHLAVVKSDVERVAVDRIALDVYLPSHGSISAEELVLERDVRDMIYFDCHFLDPSCSCLACLHVSSRQGYKL